MKISKTPSQVLWCRDSVSSKKINDGKNLHKTWREQMCVLELFWTWAVREVVGTLLMLFSRSDSV